MRPLMFTTLIILPCMIVNSCLMATTPTACPTQRAHYRYTNGPGSADFIVMPTKEPGIVSSRLALHIVITGEIINQSHNHETRSFYFLFLPVGSSGDVFVNPTNNVLAKGWKLPLSMTSGPYGLLGKDGGMRVITWGRRMHIPDSPPLLNSSAPEIILLPDLADTLHHILPEGKMMFVGKGMFRFAFCAKSSIRVHRENSSHTRK